MGAETYRADTMIRRVAFFSIFAFLLFAADPAEAVRQVAVGWTQAAVKHSHANGRTQTKAEYIAAVTKGPARYESFDFSDMKIRRTMAAGSSPRTCPLESILRFGAPALLNV